MNKILRRISFLTIYLMLFGIAGTSYWFVMTSSGARWLLEMAGTVSDVRIRAEAVTGRLANDLHISDLKIEWEEGSLFIEKIDLRWKLWRLLSGKLEVEELGVYGIHLALSEKETPVPEETALNEDRTMEPLARYIPRWLHAKINELHVEDFRVTEKDQTLFILQDLTLSSFIEDSTLVLEKFSWQSPYISLAGKARLQMEAMILDMEADVLLPDELVKHKRLASIAVPHAFAGKLKVRGSLFNYHGELTVGDLKKQGLQLSCKASGNLDGLHLEKLYGHWLKGTVQGDLFLDWRKDFSLKGELSGRGINPSQLSNDWSGQINVDVAGNLETPEKGPLRTELAITLHPSLVLTHSVTGTAKGSWDERGLILKNLFLEGDGLLVKANGPLAKRLAFQLSVKNLSHWLPEAEGRLETEGWLRFLDNYLTGDAQGSGVDLSFKGMTTPRIKFLARHAMRGGPVEILTSAHQVRYGNWTFKSWEIGAKGTPRDHVIDLEVVPFSGQAGLKGNLEGSYQHGVWKEVLKELVVHEKNLGRWTLQNPVDIFQKEKDWRFSPLILQGNRRGVLRLDGEYLAGTAEGYLEAKWHELDLSQLKPWLPAVNPWGQSRGDVKVRWKKGTVDFLEGHIKSTGGISFENQKIPVHRMAVDATWEQKGLNGTILIDLEENGELNITSSSEDPIHFGEPRNGTMEMDLQSFDLNVLRSIFPERFPLRGRLSASGQGQWLGNGRFSWQGQAHVKEGSLGWKTREPVKGQMVAKVGNAKLDWNWQRDFLNLGLELTLKEGGTLSAESTIPFNTEWPVEIRKEGPIKGKIKGSIHEWGLLTALFPDLIRETRGDIEADLNLDGTWKNPLLNGEITLKKMGGYLPMTGAQLDDIGLTTVFEGREARIDHFQIRSGSGILHGKGLVRFPQAGKLDYQFELNGKQFELANLPEVRILSELQLLLQGGMNNLSLTGEVLLTDFLISGIQKSPDVQPSRDVIIISTQEAEPEGASDFDLDIQVKVSMGEKSFIKTAGLNAQLEGEILLFMKESNLLAEGQIRTTKGNFNAYGANLNIEHGHINFTGGPADNPGLEILALRKIGKIGAGVNVTGTAEYPEINLYSRPAMPERDIIGYIFLGRRLRSDKQESDLLALGTGAIFPKGSGALQRLGFTDVDLGSLFSEEGAVRMRYRFRDSWEVESTLGDSSGVDLFHVIEFK